MSPNVGGVSKLGRANASGVTQGPRDSQMGVKKRVIRECVGGGFYDISSLIVFSLNYYLEQMSLHILIFQNYFLHRT